MGSMMMKIEVMRMGDGSEEVACRCEVREGRASAKCEEKEKMM